MGMGQGESRALSHQFNSGMVPQGCVRGMNGRSLNRPSMLCNEVMYAEPSGMTKEA